MARHVALNQDDCALALKTQSRGLREAEKRGEKSISLLRKIFCCWVLRLIGGERFDRTREVPRVFRLAVNADA